MSKIYFDPISKRQFKKNIYECVRNKKIIYRIPLILVKKYVSITTLLNKFIINDLANIISEYLNDQMELLYIISVSDDTNCLYVHIIANNVKLNFKIYNFEYVYAISYTKIKNKYRFYCTLGSDSSPCGYKFTNSDDKPYANGIKFESICFFNEYMKINYKKNEHIKSFENTSTQYVECNYNNNQYTTIYHCNDNKDATCKTLNIIITDNLKLRNVITILKMITNVINNLYPEYTSAPHLYLNNIVT